MILEGKGRVHEELSILGLTICFSDSLCEEVISIGKMSISLIKAANNYKKLFANTETMIIQYLSSELPKDTTGLNAATD